MTLVEALVWVAVFGMAVGAISSSILYFYRTNRYVLEQSQAISSAQRSIDRVVRTLREVAYSSDGAYPLVALATSSITFYADIDSDPYIERVRYTLVDETVMQGITDPIGDPLTYSGAVEDVSVLANDIRNISQGTNMFEYFDSAGNEITDLSDVLAVRFINVNVIANVNPISLPNEFTLRSSATLRNLRE